MTTFEHLLEHKAATDATDRQLLKILCQFIDKLDDAGNLPHTDSLFEFVANKLSLPPCSIDTSFEDPRFTDVDRDTIITMLIEEVQDDAKSYAHDIARGEPLVELISYCCPDIQGVVDFLRVERQHHADTYTAKYSPMQILEITGFASRMALMLDDGSVTFAGREFIERNT